MSALDNIIHLISPRGRGPLQLQRDDWRRVNPKWSMVARVFVNLLTDEAVLPRLTQATTAEELKAILFVDHYLAQVHNHCFRQQIRELLATPTVPLADIVTYAALSFAHEAIWLEGGEAEPLNKEAIVYKLAAAADQLGVSVETLYQAILDDKINAELVLTRTEIERLAAQKGTL
ncbi:MAG: hypothetical protein KA314_23230 [Chloroflexi bacterium]|nr:hypothetical protein [Chloroflexota bacterium]MBP8058758.1 hypothetical protein [Chloroflexota bacterium]